MKLYTREQMIEAFNYGKTLEGFDWIGDMIDSLEAIELPSDEEIEEKLNVAYGNGYEQGEMNFYKKMQVKGDKYAEGYTEGYKRALELVKWEIDNKLQGGNK
jgi:flagellar biosynthesis/type III secretory pathway protein FliH